LALSARMVLAMTTAPIRSDWVGRVIDGRYPLRQWLGGSERSGVFLTDFAGQPEQRAALKLIAADATDALAKTAAWATVRSLSHPHLMRLLTNGRCEIDSAKFLYFVTEYAPENLAEILPERPLTAAETGKMLASVLDALTYLHANGLGHGSLKPSNILVVNDQLKLSSDEILGGGVVSAAADMWSLGMTVVETLTQHPPDWERAMGGDPKVPESVPQPFFDIAKGCLRVAPERRWTIKQVRARLDGALVEEEAAADVAGKIKVASQRRFGMALAAVVAVLLVSVGLYFRWAGIGQVVTPDHKPGGVGAESDLSPSASIPKPSPIKGRVSGSDLPEPAEKPEKAEQPERDPTSGSPGSADDSAVLQRVMPEVLPAAQASIHGEFDVKIRVTVGPDGAVSDAAFDSAGPSRYFSKQALEASRHWRFKPAQMAGENVRSVWLLEYHFTESGVEIAATQISP